jgi:hypothetical protein
VQQQQQQQDYALLERLIRTDERNVSTKEEYGNSGIVSAVEGMSSSGNSYSAAAQ